MRNLSLLSLPESIAPATGDHPSIPLANEKHSHSREHLNGPEEEDEEYITGFRLMLILTAGTLVQFVMMLDQSIIATV